MEKKQNPIEDILQDCYLEVQGAIIDSLIYPRLEIIEILTSSSMQ